MGQVEDAFDDDLLFGEDLHSPRTVSSEHGKEQWETEADTELDKPGIDVGNSTSQQSSMMRFSSDDITSPVPTPSPPIDLPAMRPRQMLQQFGDHRLAASMPARAYTGLGTSAPINIPNMARWRGGGQLAPGSNAGGRAAAGADGAPAVIVASTFVPPHQLSRRDDFTLSLPGVSPSAVKRDRLRSRNAILRSTGFIEPQAPLATAAVAAVEAALDAAAPALRPQLAHSSLTAALSTIGEAG